MLALIKYTAWLGVLALTFVGEPLAGITLGIGLIVGAIWGAATEQKNRAARDRKATETIRELMTRAGKRNDATNH